MWKKLLVNFTKSASRMARLTQARPYSSSNHFVPSISFTKESVWIRVVQKFPDYLQPFFVQWGKRKLLSNHLPFYNPRTRRKEWFIAVDTQESLSRAIELLRAIDSKLHVEQANEVQVFELYRQLRTLLRKGHVPQNLHFLLLQNVPCSVTQRAIFKKLSLHTHIRDAVLVAESGRKTQSIDAKLKNELDMSSKEEEGERQAPIDTKSLSSDPVEDGSGVADYLVLTDNPELLIRSVHMQSWSSFLRREPTYPSLKTERILERFAPSKANKPIESMESKDETEAVQLPPLLATAYTNVFTVNRFHDLILRNRHTVAA